MKNVPIKGIFLLKTALKNRNCSFKQKEEEAELTVYAIAVNPLLAEVARRQHIQLLSLAEMGPLKKALLFWSPLKLDQKRPSKKPLQNV